MASQRQAKANLKRNPDWPCNYCKRKGVTMALWRSRERLDIEGKREFDLWFYVCTDPACLEKAARSRVSGEWRDLNEEEEEEESTSDPARSPAAAAMVIAFAVIIAIVVVIFTCEL